MASVSTWPWFVVVGAAAGCLYVAFVLWLLVCGRRTNGRTVARLVPDCLVLVGRLLRDERVSRANKLLLLALAGYLAMPLDLVPDVIPIAGQLDDAILVVLVLRRLLRDAGPDLLRRHWPGPATSLEALTRLLLLTPPVRQRRSAVTKRARRERASGLASYGDRR